mmetsp:Transcript_83824/g.259205  ORF Transcript_83824/g.259205 Transcript_83824/m.259205 type:complete len:278 (-) Transcript_83824:253-1086(-)
MKPPIVNSRAVSREGPREGGSSSPGGNAGHAAKASTASCGGPSSEGPASLFMLESAAGASSRCLATCSASESLASASDRISARAANISSRLTSSSGTSPGLVPAPASPGPSPPAVCKPLLPGNGLSNAAGDGANGAGSAGRDCRSSSLYLKPEEAKGGQAEPAASCSSGRSLIAKGRLVYHQCRLRPPPRSAPAASSARMMLSETRSCSAMSRTLRQAPLPFFLLWLGSAPASKSRHVARRLLFDTACHNALDLLGVRSFGFDLASRSHCTLSVSPS